MYFRQFLWSLESGHGASLTVVLLPRAHGFFMLSLSAFSRIFTHPYSIHSVSNIYFCAEKLRSITYVLGYSEMMYFERGQCPGYVGGASFTAFVAKGA